MGDQPAPQGKVRIMHIIGQLAVGGCEKQLLQLCRRMDPRRYELTVCWYSRFPEELGDEFAKAGVRLVFVDKFQLPRWKFFFELVKTIRRIEPDIVHTWMYSANAWGRWAALAARVPCMIASERVEILSSTRLYRLSERLLAKHSKLLVNSYSVARSMAQQYGLPLNSIDVAYNAVELPACDPVQSRLSVREELGLPVDSKVILMVARLDPQKNWPMFFRVARRICDVRNDAYFVGIGTGTLLSEFQDMIRKEGLEDRVHLLGTRLDVPRWLAAADLFCFTSDFEGFPNAVLEAMMAGAPVLCTRFDSAAELLTDPALGCLVPKDDDQAMAEQAIKLLDDLPRRMAIGAAAQATVQERYDWNTLLRTMEQFYETTLAAGV
jgi:glycosyltransferase involved in cell wall biosynthesis